MTAKFVHLHNHSDNSSLDGMATIPGFVARAKQLGQSAMGLMDHGTIAGSYEFYTECLAAGIEPILASEHYFAPDAIQAKENKDAERFHVGVIAKGQAGYEVLVELSTEAHRRFYYKPMLDRALIESMDAKDRAQLVVLSGCAASILSRKALGGMAGSVHEELSWWTSMFPNFYIELMHHNTDFDRKLNTRLIKLARKHKLPWVITNDPHYVMKDDAHHHDALLAVQTNAGIDDEERFRFQGDGYYLKSRKEMRRAFREYGDEIWKPGAAATIEIARSCRTRIAAWDTRSWHIPVYPDLHTTADRQLAEEARAGLKAKGLSKSKKYNRRLKCELAAFRKLKMANFMLITADACNEARTRGIRVGPGRGSVAGTLVGYLIGIHSIDSVKYDLLFERFLNPDRPKMPDIDTDFQRSRRSEMFDYMEEKYGTENTMRVGAYQRMQTKAAFKALVRAYGVPFQEANTLSKLIVEDEEGNAVLPAEVEQGYPDLHATLTALTGIKKGVSRHPAGIIVFDPDDPIKALVPEMWIASSEKFVSQFDLEAIAGMGLLKQDFLGLRTLDTVSEIISLVSDVLGLIEASHGIKLDPDAWVPGEEPGDKAVWKMLRDGHTAGVFQMEGGANARGIQEIKCDSFQSIINCFPAGTEVSGPPAIGAVESWYEGELLTITFASGKRLSVTPNHPLLGPSGWQAAEALNVGDHLLRATLGQDFIALDPDVQDRPSKIHEVVGSLQALAGAERIAPLAVNLHGHRPATDVNVVRPNRLLWERVQARLKDPLSQNLLELAYLGAGDLLGASPGSLGFGQGSEPNTFVSTSSGSSHSSPFILGETAVMQIDGLGHTTSRDACRFKSALDESGIRGVTLRESLLTFATEITLDEIIEINVSTERRHVYTLQTCDDWFLAEGIIAHNCTSLYRAGPMIAGSVQRYLANKNDKKVRVAHPILKPYLEDTWGEMIFQEQMFQILKECAGLSWARVDDAKTALTRKDPVKMAGLRTEVVEGFQRHSQMSVEKAEEVWEQMAAQASYLFAKTHATAYSMLSYQTARLKYLYPLEYLGALLRTVEPKNDSDKGKREAYMTEAMRLGFKIQPPDVNVSDDRFMPNGKNELLFGLTDIKNVGEKAALKITEARKRRKSGAFTRVDQVAAAVNNVGTVRALAQAGALRSLGVEPETEKQEELLAWQFTDPVAPFRKKYASKIRLPSKTRNNQVWLLGEITKIEKRKTKNGNDFRTWVVRSEPGSEFKITLWESAADAWSIPRGSVVVVEGIWNQQWSNLSIGKSEQVRVIQRRITNKKEDKR